MRIFVAILVNVARHATTKVIQLAKLANGPRSSAVILICDGILFLESKEAHYASPPPKKKKKVIALDRHQSMQNWKAKVGGAIE